MNQQLITHNGTRILCIAELRGQLSLLNSLAEQYNASVILHTGSFGFFDNMSISKIHESYLRHIVAFSPLLSQGLLDKISELSRANGEYVDHDVEALRDLLNGVQISELMDFVNGYKKLNVPVYTIYGMIEDSSVLNKFKIGEYYIPNLFILDEDHTYTLNINDEVDLFLCGLGGSLSYQKLFHQGNSVTTEEVDEIVTRKGLLPIAGEPGNVWLTMLQIGQFIKTVETNSKNGDVKILLTHPSPSREGLLAHLSVYLKIDYTISNGLHFLYPSSFNELSVCPNFEYYKSKFSDSRNQLSAIWVKVQDTIENMIGPDSKLQDLLGTALNAFDRIPVINSKAIHGGGGGGSHNNPEHEEITPLSLSFNRRDINSNTIRLQSDAYYLSFQNQWHFNLCDVSIGSVVLNVEDGRIKFEANSKGFDFSFKKDGREIRERRSNGFRRTQQGGGGFSSNNSNSNNSNNGNSSGPIGSGFRGRGRGRGGYKR